MRAARRFSLFSTSLTPALHLRKKLAAFASSHISDSSIRLFSSEGSRTASIIPLTPMSLSIRPATVRS